MLLGMFKSVAYNSMFTFHVIGLPTNPYNFMYKECFLNPQSIPNFNGPFPDSFSLVLSFHQSK